MVKAGLRYPGTIRGARPDLEHFYFAKNRKEKFELSILIITLQKSRKSICWLPKVPRCSDVVQVEDLREIGYKFREDWMDLTSKDWSCPPGGPRSRDHVGDSSLQKRRDDNQDSCTHFQLTLSLGWVKIPFLFKRVKIYSTGLLELLAVKHS